VGNHEIDLIVRDGQTGELVFVEVKTRTSEQFGSPSSAVTRKKIKSLQAVAEQYLKTNKLFENFRYDIIAVLPGSIEHYQNITWNY